MNWRLSWHKAAVKGIERLDRPTRERIHEAVRQLAASGVGDVRYLEGTSNPRKYRLRVGDWRVTFTQEPDGPTSGVLTVVAFSKRGDAYRNL